MLRESGVSKQGQDGSLRLGVRRCTQEPDYSVLRARFRDCQDMRARKRGISMWSLPLHSGRLSMCIEGLSAKGMICQVDSINRA